MVIKPGELPEVLPRALATGRPAVIDCIIDPKELLPIETFVADAKTSAIQLLL